jgi:hypothetical protein
MIVAIRACVVLAENPEIAIPGLKVGLYDRDQASMDDFLGSGVTDERGEYRFVFDTDAYTDEEDQPMWKIDSLPDLYVMIYNRSGEIIFSTREQVVENNLPKVILIGMPRELADMHHLLDELNL